MFARSARLARLARPVRPLPACVRVFAWLSFSLTLFASSSCSRACHNTQPDEHEFCCIEPTDKCSLQDGCRYQDTWGATCPAGTQEIKACVMESWFNTREFCCPVDDTSKCNPASRPELRCEYMVGLSDVVCPAGRYEETSCKVTKMGGLYEHEL